MKRLLFFGFCILDFVFCIQTFAACNPNTNKAWFDEYSDGQYSFECNVQNVCLGQKFGGGYWNFDTSKQLIKTHDRTKYPDLSKEQKKFDEIKTIYQKTQDTIFECALLKSKYATHTQIIKDYKPTDKSKQYLEKLNESVKEKLREKECLWADEADKVYNYKDLLDSLSYEECVYNMYLYYYEEKAGNSLGMLIEPTDGYVRAGDISKNVDEARAMLENEHDFARTALNNALKWYENFHKNYVPHTMMQMNYIDLSENKSWMAKIMHGVKQLVSLFTGAQKQTN